MSPSSWEDAFEIFDDGFDDCLLTFFDKTAWFIFSLNTFQALDVSLYNSLRLYPWMDLLGGKEKETEEVSLVEKGSNESNDLRDQREKISE